MSRRLATPVAIEVARADHPDAVCCLAAYYAELDERFPHGFDVAATTRADVDGMALPVGQFLLARVAGNARGCAGLRTIEPGVGEIKRMWIDPTARGAGLARRLLVELEGWATRLEMHTVRLDTAAVLEEAIALYADTGYEATEAYNDNPYAAHWFEKTIQA